MPDIDTDSINVNQSGVNRIALQLAGFFEHFDSERIQVIGKVEYAYLEQFDVEHMLPIYEKIFESKIPNTVKVGESVYYSEPLIEYAPDSNACRAYNKLAGEVIAYEG